MPASAFVHKILDVLVLIILVGALIGVVVTQLANYAANDTTFGPTLQILVPLLIGVAILVYVYTELVPTFRK